MSDLSLTVTRTIGAPVERVFNAWLDADKLARFMLPGEGMETPVVDTDPVVGGRFNILMKAGEQEIPHSGIYKEIARYTRLIFTWDSPFSAPESTVTVDFKPAGNGTEVTLTHVKFPSEESRGNHEGGWARILEVLDSLSATDLAA